MNYTPQQQAEARHRAKVAALTRAINKGDHYRRAIEGLNAAEGPARAMWEFMVALYAPLPSKNLP